MAGDKAVLIGINDYENVRDLRGCHQDVEDIRELLIDVFGFEADSIRPILGSNAKKTHVQEAMQWMFDDVEEGDRLVFHFSGHGSFNSLDGSIPNEVEDGLVVDGIICLQDFDFGKADTCFTSLELRNWTRTKPVGAELLVILDSCHSEGGTREILRPGTKDHILINEKVFRKRALALQESFELRGTKLFKTLSSSLQKPVLANANIFQLMAEHDNLYQDSRFIRPPNFSSATRDVLRKKERTDAMNHVFLAACEIDEVAADAVIEGKPNGAFTRALCNALRQTGATAERQNLIMSLREALKEWDQTPQLEAKSTAGALFSAMSSSPASDAGGSDSDDDADGSDFEDSLNNDFDSRSAATLLSQIIEPSNKLTADNQRRALGILKKIVGSKGARSSRATGARQLVYVHGICSHPAGYSDDWWDALHPYTQAFGTGQRGQRRHEVLWSHLVNDRELSKSDRNASAQATAEWAARVRGVLEERTVSQADVGSESRSISTLNRDRMRSIEYRDAIAPTKPAVRDLHIPGFGCVDDFSWYMFNADIRAQVIAEFTETVQRLLDNGDHIDVISHSWGTVVAYEGLRELEAVNSGRINNFFTVGAALSIFLVKSRLREENRDGRKPANVRKWINLDAHGDPVGGQLRNNPFEVDHEYLDLDNLGCGWLSPSCAHSSYFDVENETVNRDIFAHFINTA
jgi:metacaspase-1